MWGGKFVNIREPKAPLPLAFVSRKDPAYSSNIARWCHPPFNALVREARASLSQPTRLLALAKAQQIFSEEQPWMTLGYSDVVKAYRKEVRGYHPGPTTADSFYGISVVTE